MFKSGEQIDELIHRFLLDGGYNNDPIEKPIFLLDTNKISLALENLKYEFK